jgi:YD repeat-containing protein
MKKKIKISYTYDRLNRLSTVTRNGKAGKRYDYDPAGNLIAISSNISEKSEESVADKEPTAREERFAALEEEYNRLNDLVQAGSLSLEQFQGEVNRLRFQDAGGTWWQLSFDGIWLKWDGTAWIEKE